MTVLGIDLQTNHSVAIGDRERRSGLYILGKPGMGKSTLLVNLIQQDIDRRYGVFFLDPHGEAIFDTIRCKSVVDCINEYNQVRLLNPADETYSFGINPLECEKVESLSARQHALNKTLNVFRRLWGQDNLWGVYLERILQSALPIFIEVQDYTLSEMPLFLTNASFRRHVLERVQYNIHLLDYWQYEFKPEQAQSALNRIGILLSNPYVRDVIGQKETTVDFPAYAKWGYAVFLHLPTTIDLEARRFVGTIFLSELFHALYNRPEEAKQHNFGLYVDEFQQFATDQFADFILEGRKFGVATTIAHQERVGQFGENQKILGATMACANKVIFQVTPRDARELAPEFAEKPVALESRLVPEMVICKEPMWHLLRIGHKNPRIQELFRKHLLSTFQHLDRAKAKTEQMQLERSGFFNDALLYRDQASLSGVDERKEGRLISSVRGRDITISNVALDRTETMLQQAMQSHSMAKEAHEELRGLLLEIQGGRERLYRDEEFLVALMEGNTNRIARNELLAQYLTDVLASGAWMWSLDKKAMSMEIYNLCKFYFDLRYGDPYKDHVISMFMNLWPLPKPLTKNSKNEPFQLLQFALMYFPEQTEKAFFQYKYRWYAGKSAEKIKELWENDKAILYTGGENKVYTTEWVKDPWGTMREQRLKVPRHSFNSLSMDDIQLGVLNESERASAIELCIREIKRIIPDLLDKESEVLEFCELLSQPENHILVSSGQYVEKPVSIASTQEMTNQAIQALTDLPRFQAYAKTIQEQDGRQEVWKGRIATNAPPARVNDRDIEDQITQITREKCCKPRSEIAKEIAQRRLQWRSTGGGDDAPPSRIM